MERDDESRERNRDTGLGEPKAKKERKREKRVGRMVAGQECDLLSLVPHN